MIINLASAARVIPVTALMLLVFISRRASQALPRAPKTAGSKSSRLRRDAVYVKRP